jgi:glyoxylase-like metal-dependent hydrolase (beta-lactamase superfamily II)
MECFMEYECVYQGNMVEVFKISDNFYFRRANLPVRGQCNGAFIVGDREVAIVDAPPGGIEMLDEVEQLFHKPVTALFLTHGHGDHVEGLGPFLDRDLTVYCNYRIMDTVVPRDKKCRAGFSGVHDRLDLRLSGGIDIELFILNQTAHSKGDMFVRAPALGIVCTGDCVVEYQTAYFHTADVKSWIYSVRELGAMKGKYILPGHSPELLPYTYTEDFADYLSVVRNCAEVCFDRFHNQSGDQTVKQRCASVTTDEVRQLVETFFTERNADTLFLEEKAGTNDARRVVRMALWEIIREGLR